MMGLVIHHDLELGNGICLLVNSVGGSLQAALGLHACIACNPASESVATVLYGLVALSGILLDASGDFRVGLQHGRFMLHQSEGQQLGVSSEVMLAAREVIRLSSGQALERALAAISWAGQGHIWIAAS